MVRAEDGEQAVTLFALDDKRRLRLFSPERELDPGPGWTVVSLAVNGDRRS